jgi:hypothetical protein
MVVDFGSTFVKSNAEDVDTMNNNSGIDLQSSILLNFMTCNFNFWNLYVGVADADADTNKRPFIVRIYGSMVFAVHTISQLLTQKSLVALDLTLKNWHKN